MSADQRSNSSPFAEGAASVCAGIPTAHHWPLLAPLRRRGARCGEGRHNDGVLRAELRRVGKMLELATAAAINRVMRAARIDAIGRGYLERLQRPSGERFDRARRTTATSPGAARGTKTTIPSVRPTPSPPAAMPISLAEPPCSSTADPLAAPRVASGRGRACPPPVTGPMLSEELGSARRALCPPEARRRPRREGLLPVAVARLLGQRAAARATGSRSRRLRNSRVLDHAQMELAAVSMPSTVSSSNARCIRSTASAATAPTRSASRASDRRTAQSRSPSPRRESQRTPGPPGTCRYSMRPVDGRNPFAGSSLVMRHSIAQPRGTMSSCSNGTSFASRDADLPLHQVDASDELGDRMFDLDARVHLEEIELAVRVEQELAGSRVGVPGRHRERRRPRRPCARAARALQPSSVPPRSSSGAGAARNIRARRGGASCHAGRRAPVSPRAVDRRCTSRRIPHRRRMRSSPRAARRRATGAISSREWTTRIPFPPPPAAALSRTG